MRHYSKILIWENKRRFNKLIEFRELAIEYFNNSRPTGWENSSRIQDDAAIEARFKINLVIDEVHSIILTSGTIPILSWTAPAAIGGRAEEIDLITNIFNLNGFQIEPNHVLDFIDRAIGIYQSNHKSACWKTVNPFFYIGVVLDAISNLPFIAIGKLGFNRQKIEASLIGRIFKGVFCIGSWIAIIITILDFFGYLDVLEPAKQIVHKLLGSNKTN